MTNFFRISRKYYSILCLCLLFGHCKGYTIPRQAPVTKNLCPVLSLGNAKMLNQFRAGTIWVENGKIIRVTHGPKGIEVKGLQVGSSLLRVGEQTCRVQVMSHDNFEFWTKLKTFTKQVIGLSTDLENGIPQVSGTLFYFNDWLTIKSLAPPNSSYNLRTKIASNLQREIQHKITKILEAAKLPPQNLVFSDQIEVHVNKKNKSETTKMMKILGPYGIHVEESNSAVELEPLIKVEITVAEVVRDFYSKLGATWPAELSAQILPRQKLLDNSLSVLGEFFESRGVGKVLASPNILCRTGKEAEFLAGGEFPIKIGGSLRKAGGVTWKKYGILLKVKPTADRTGRMSIAIETEVSHIDPARTVDNIPGLITNKMSSHFDLKKPRIIALSGLIRHSEGENTKGLWGLSEIPILGSLFASTNFQRNRSELVIFVRPSLVDENPEILIDEGDEIESDQKSRINFASESESIAGSQNRNLQELE